MAGAQDMQRMDMRQGNPRRREPVPDRDADTGLSLHQQGAQQNYLQRLVHFVCSDLGLYS